MHNIKGFLTSSEHEGGVTLHSLILLNWRSVDELVGGGLAEAQTMNGAVRAVGALRTKGSKGAKLAELRSRWAARSKVERLGTVTDAELTLGAITATELRLWAIAETELTLRNVTDTDLTLWATELRLRASEELVRAIESLRSLRPLNAIGSVHNTLGALRSLDTLRSVRPVVLTRRSFRSEVLTNGSTESLDALRSVVLLNVSELIVVRGVVDELLTVMCGRTESSVERVMELEPLLGMGTKESLLVEALRAVRSLNVESVNNVGTSDSLRASHSEVSQVLSLEVNSVRALRSDLLNFDVPEVAKNVGKEVIELGVLLHVIEAVSTSADDAVKLLSSLLDVLLILFVVIWEVDWERKMSLLDNILDSVVVTIGAEKIEEQILLNIFV